MPMYFVLPCASLSILDLFSQPFLLNIPNYQRQYQWGAEHAGQLLDDLVGGLSFDNPRSRTALYFLGTMLLKDSLGKDVELISAKMPAREFDVVDGHQRVLTFAMLFAALRDLAPNSALATRVNAMLNGVAGKSALRRGTPRERLRCLSADREIFESYVLKPGATLIEAPDESDLTPSQSSLLEARDHFVSQLRDTTDHERFALFDYATSNCHVVVIAHHDQNYAYEWFSRLNDRGKKLDGNDRLKAHVLDNAGDDSRAWTIQVWDQASAELGNGFDPFFSYLRSVCGYRDEPIVDATRRIVLEHGSPEKFLKNTFIPLTAAYKDVLRGGEGTDDLPPDIARQLVYLNRLAPGDWMPAAMLALRDWRNDPGQAARLIGEIDRFAHLLRLLSLGNAKLASRFGPVVAGLRSGSIIDGSHEAFELTSTELRHISYHLRDLHKRNARLCKLVLLRVSDQIDGVVTIVSPAAYSVEHVMPQRPPAASQWLQWHPNPSERGRLAESFGNLVLVSERLNQKARNASFGFKKEIFGHTEPGAPLLAVTRDVLESAEWRAADILEREQRLLAVLEATWRIDLGLSKSAPDPSKSAKPKTNPRRKSGSG